MVSDYIRKLKLLQQPSYRPGAVTMDGRLTPYRLPVGTHITAKRREDAAPPRVEGVPEIPQGDDSRKGKKT